MKFLSADLPHVGLLIIAPEVQTRGVWLSLSKSPIVIEQAPKHNPLNVWDPSRKAQNSLIDTLCLFLLNPRQQITV